MNAAIPMKSARVRPLGPSASFGVDTGSDDGRRELDNPEYSLLVVGIDELGAADKFRTVFDVMAAIALGTSWPL
jgi:hypothetical protein